MLSSDVSQPERLLRFLYFEELATNEFLFINSLLVPTSAKRGLNDPMVNACSPIIFPHTEAIFPFHRLEANIAEDQDSKTASPCVLTIIGKCKSF